MAGGTVLVLRNKQQRLDVLFPIRPAAILEKLEELLHGNGILRAVIGCFGLAVFVVGAIHKGARRHGAESFAAGINDLSELYLASGLNDFAALT
jgi:hypothetical protein